jgi:hypothetical protein
MLLFLLFVRQKLVVQKSLHLIKADAGSGAWKTAELIGEGSDGLTVARANSRCRERLSRGGDRRANIAW